MDISFLVISPILFELQQRTITHFKALDHSFDLFKSTMALGWKTLGLKSKKSVSFLIVQTLGLGVSCTGYLLLLIQMLFQHTVDFCVVLM